MPLNCLLQLYHMMSLILQNEREATSIALQMAVIMKLAWQNAIYILSLVNLEGDSVFQIQMKFKFLLFTVRTANHRLSKFCF